MTINQHRQADSTCFHCGLDVPAGSSFTTTIKGEVRRMCCPGCQAVAQTIVDSGLDNYYRHRTGTAAAPDVTRRELSEMLGQELALYDLESIQRDFVAHTEDGLRNASLVIEGITCAACVWLLEHHLAKLEGIGRASVNLTTHRARVTWDQSVIPLSRILGEIHRIGYQAHPYHPDKEEQRLEKEKKLAIRRLGVAGIGMMQVMMMAVALYGGALQGIEDQYVTFIRWASLVIATPVVVYAARPFFIAALRDLRVRQLSMDVPVSIAIGGAYLSSIWATATNSGEVYYDSVTMFTFFLLIGRYLEMQARHRTGRAGNSMLNLLPASAIKLVDGSETLVPASDLAVGDRILVKPGHTVPADGIIIEGNSSIDESALTGEYLPVSKAPGEAIVGGTINVESPLHIEITHIGAQTQLSAIVRLLERAHEDKPKVARIADRVASYFVAAVLSTAAVVGFSWWQLAPEDAFWITLSVLVVTCPCALSLATPTALTAATGALRQHGILVTRGHVMESLANATHVVFDKTGTLTEGNLTLQQVVPLANLSPDQLHEIAAALEAHSSHPIARAFASHSGRHATEVEVTLGQGLQGTVQGQRFRIGKPAYAAAICQQPCPTTPPAPGGQWLLLCSDAEPLAWFQLNDQLRREAKATIQRLKALGVSCQMLTGDSSDAVTEVNRELELHDIIAGVSPEQKLKHVQQLQQRGAKVIMVGDGINDIPVLAGAETSVAMGSATDLAKTNADAVLISADLMRLADAIEQARKTQRIIRQNLGWAIVYNLLALPLAALGYIAPYMAALGMSASSLVVVGNALRLSKIRSHNRLKS